MEKEEICLGLFMGYDIVLKNVPKERAQHVSKAANYHFEKMMAAYLEKNGMVTPNTN